MVMATVDSGISSNCGKVVAALGSASGRMPPAPNITENLNVPNTRIETAMVVRFLSMMFAKFRGEPSPASSNANPGCIMKIMAEHKNIQTKFMPDRLAGVLAKKPLSC